MSNSLQPHGLQPVRLLCPWGFSRPEYWSGLPGPPPGDLPNPGLPPLQVDSLPAEPQGKLKNTEGGSLSHLQRIFPTQELNRGLPHCRWILYQLSHQGSPHTQTQTMHFPPTAMSVPQAQIPTSEEKISLKVNRAPWRNGPCRPEGGDM